MLRMMLVHVDGRRPCIGASTFLNVVFHRPAITSSLASLPSRSSCRAPGCRPRSRGKKLVLVGLLYYLQMSISEASVVRRSTTQRCNRSRAVHFFLSLPSSSSSRPMNVRNGSTTEDVPVQLTARQLEEKKQAVAVVLVRSSTCFLYKLRKDVNGFLAWLMIMMMMGHDNYNRYYSPRQKNMQTTPTQTPRSPLLHCAYRRSCSKKTSSEPDIIRIRKVEDEAEDFMRK
mmetsp:Transcript_28011/g.70909  ORF Transcript_28011/g.70909 Transcript_28011/m.70909 type:complete len:229 (+) Transcript_28011:6262-6948(+)